MHITGIYYYHSQRIGLKDYIFQVTIIQSVFNTPMMVYQGHCKP